MAVMSRSASGISLLGARFWKWGIIAKIKEEKELNGHKYDKTPNQKDIPWNIHWVFYFCLKPHNAHSCPLDLICASPDVTFSTPMSIHLHLFPWPFIFFWYFFHISPIQLPNFIFFLLFLSLFRLDSLFPFAISSFLFV